jgi:hypothetical protein
VQRVGDLGTHGKPDLFNRVIETTTLSDFVIFPSEWSRNQLSLPTEKTVVITNAPSQKFFVTGQKKDYRGTLEIVTHHWSDNVMKGFEVYREVDKFCQSSAGDFRFTYVGRKPASFSPVNLVPPQDITGLVYNLSKAHVYLTASQQEAGANHVLEAMAMKLPVLYHSGGGSIVEYCAGRGFSYDSVDQLFDILKNRKKDIEITQENMDYSRTGDHMAEEYVKLFESMS